MGLRPQISIEEEYVMRLSKSKSVLPSLTRAAIIGGLSLFLIGCGKDLTVEPDYPERQKTSLEGMGSILDNQGFSLFSRSNSDTVAPTLAVNSFLWRAALDTFSFMPFASADQLSGVIITDWYIEPGTPDERMKVSVLVLDKELRADALRVTAFREKRTNFGWESTPVAEQTNRSLEDVVLVRARELRIADLAIPKD